ncbi:MAG: hypothetical protein HOP16_14490 [Acidobacteria bacterium]|nr:hypothetical protein [Acidobacteriota bacterium]
MEYIGRGVLAAVLTFLISASAVAQESGSAPPALPKWDIAGGLGLLYLRSGELFSPCTCGVDYWDQTAEFRIDFGRYWTEHIKTSVSVGLSPDFDDYETRILQIDGIDRYVGNERAARVRTVSPSVTYQFLSNTFMHPYVSGGVRVAVVDEHRFREPSTYQFSGVRYAVPRLDERRTLVLAKPFLAAGAKSYLSDTAFVRSEILTAFRSDGITQVSLHLGVGLDF